MALSSTFVAVGVSSSQGVAAGERVSWSATGTFVATVALEFSDNGGAWAEVERFKSARDGVGFVAERSGLYRFRCISYTSGTVTYALSTAAQILKEFVGPNGKKPLSITEDGIDVVGAATVSGAATIGGAVSVGGILSLPSVVQALVGAGAPTDGTSGTGFGTAGPGSLYIDITNANLYINGNTKASPTWKLVTRAA